MYTIFPILCGNPMENNNAKSLVSD